MSAGIGELFIELAFKGDAKGADDFKKKVDELAKSMNATVKVSKKAASQSKENIAGLIKGYFAVVGAIKSVTAAYNNLINAMSSNQTWINLTRQTDLALESLQGYANVASVLDKSLGAEGAAQGIASLEQKLYDLQLTGQGAEGFMYAGINPMGKNAFQIIEELRNRIKGLNNVQASFLLKQMGIDPRMLGMLRMTREEFEALNAELRQYQLTDEQRQAMQKYQEQLSIAAKKLQYFKESVILALMPVITKFVKGLTAIAQAFNNIAKSSHPLAKLTKVVTGLVAAVIALGVAIWAITAHPVVAAITAVIGLIMALIGAIYLIVDDVIAWLQGRDSVLGVLLGVIDQIVADDRVPQWIRDLLYIIGQAPRLLKKIDGWNNKNSSSETAQDESQKPSAIDRVKTLGAAYTANFAVGHPLLTGAALIYSGAMEALRAGGNNITQNNYINTSETANTVQEELIHAQSINNYGD